jgi:hypothetical protein
MEQKSSIYFPKYEGLEYAEVTGIGYEEGVYRRDNSNVIEVDGYYYVYYNKGPAWNHFLTEWRGSVWAARSSDGFRWEEMGEMIPTGPEGEWDGWSAYCPNILKAKDGSYFLYYTGQPENQQAETRIHIGVGISKSPEGPFEKYGNGPIFSPTGDENEFDGFRVDDASVIPRAGEYWMYYKGRGTHASVCETKIGLAVSDTPVGLWRRHEHNPVVEEGHEIMVWPHGTGVAIYAHYCRGSGNNQFGDFYYAEDGVHFRKEFGIAADQKGGWPRNPGGYFPDCYDDPENGWGGTWGISFMPANGSEYLTRFSMDLRSGN